jgi:hypothetical protein
MVIIMSLLCQLSPAASVSDPKLKSAFLLNFTKFVEWPPERFAGMTEPIVFGLIADQTMHQEVSAIVAGRQINGRALLVRTVTGVGDLPMIHILFVSTHEQDRHRVLLERAAQFGVLVVGDDKNCRFHGGSICFMQVGEKLRFEINIDAAERSQLKISAQLQKLAVAVNKGG